MTVAELIEHLKTLPQDAPIGYENNCADYGLTFYSDLRATFKNYGPHGPSNFPRTGAWVLE